MWFRRRDQFSRDVAHLAAVAEIDPGRVKGFTVVTYLHDGQALITTNACCTKHALGDLAALNMARSASLVLCSGE